MVDVYCYAISRIPQWGSFCFQMQNVFCLNFKASARSKPFVQKLVLFHGKWLCSSNIFSYKVLRAETRFETEVRTARKCSVKTKGAWILLENLLAWPVNNKTFYNLFVLQRKRTREIQLGGRGPRRVKAQVGLTASFPQPRDLVLH